ncbi:MAG: hypothetical protein GYA36_22630 [Veillonellaceae bacterium]|nr:hypothetical protein [Veillonellaceae bacterium]
MRAIKLGVPVYDSRIIQMLHVVTKEINACLPVDKIGDEINNFLDNIKEQGGIPIRTNQVIYKKRVLLFVECIGPKIINGN